eukprot:56273-Alexandrium_andersonii.AAC.1
MSASLVGSEMCIRDRQWGVWGAAAPGQAWKTARGTCTRFLLPMLLPGAEVGRERAALLGA